jgi:hypothetical protein
MRRQFERYRQLGRGARVIAYSPRHLSLELADNADARLVDEAAAIERECCPFFDVSWNRAARRLSFAVSSAENEPALDAILFSLGIAAPANR